MSSRNANLHVANASQVAARDGRILHDSIDISNLM